MKYQNYRISRLRTLAALSVAALSIVEASSVFAQPAAPASQPAAGVVNGGFEDRTLRPWKWVVNGAKASGAIDKQVHNGGAQSYKLTSTSEFAPNIFAGTTQKVRGLKPNTSYWITLWAKGKSVSHCWFGGGPSWGTRRAIPEGDFDWQEVTVEYTTAADETTFDLIIGVDGPTESLWIDDVKMTEQ